MGVDIKADSDLDAVFVEVGAFGPFQIVTYLLLCIPTVLSATFATNYMITAHTLDHRCRVPECDIDGNNRDIAYDQPWLNLAIPSHSGKFDNCVRYAPIAENVSNTPFNDIYQCSSDMFNTSVTIPCTEYIYGSDERNIQTEFNIHCSDSYQLGFVGTVDNIARLISLPVVGILSDRFGRLTVIIYGLISYSVFGLMKSFATSYWMFLIFNFLEACDPSTFAGTFVLAIEGVNSNYRVVGSMMLALAFPVGEIVLGFAAMYFHDFRTLIRVLYAPGLLFVVYIWIIPESVRWLLVTGRVDRAVEILKSTARINRKKLSDKSIELITMKYSIDSAQNNGSQCNDDEEKKNASVIQTIRSILTSKTLCLRFAKLCYIWITCCFCYYGLSLGATNISGENRYTSFIVVSLIEIPGVLLAMILLKRMKRRQLMFIMLFITSISSIGTPWIPEQYSWLVLSSFMIGKAAITCAINGIYVYTAEQFPTNIRTTTLNSCSMIGRFGSMAAPLIAILATQYESLPAILFSCTAVVGAVAVLFCPETFARKLPDTLEEAKNL